MAAHVINITNTLIANQLIHAPADTSVNFDNTAGPQPVRVKIEAGESVHGNFTFSTITLGDRPRVWYPQAALDVADQNVFWFEILNGQFLGREMAPVPNQPGQFVQVNAVVFV
ncbi:hypothetical protein NW761_015062 [Fusarium oxysporum]|nr:hypothetical protein NW758_013518 [Fusarium oxysporum]KAJ4070922.1 hypothetical protein NW761_015062 [Fusarium oxysporum]WKT40268.1 hypothetical protein QSH57_005074 [Fusarium oxysporum f. sp. vasinfectum]